jgi:hypothetical protein
VKANASLIIGIDFLFWQCYGKVKAEEDRMHRFEAALGWLEEIQCPLVLGVIPDASSAVNRILGPEEIPEPETIAAVNERLRQWADAHKDRIVVRLADFMKSALHNEPIEVHRQKIDETSLLLQGDKLHPTPRGAAVLALAIVDQLRAQVADPDANEIQWDLQKVFRQGWDYVESVLAKRVGPAK